MQLQLLVRVRHVVAHSDELFFTVRARDQNYGHAYHILVWDAAGVRARHLNSTVILDKSYLQLN